MYSYFLLHRLPNRLQQNLKCVRCSLYFGGTTKLTGSRFAFKNPRLIRTDLWLDCGVSSGPDSLSSSFITLSGYCFLSSSMVGIDCASSSHVSSLPFSAFVVRRPILSSPYSPHANSITEKGPSDLLEEWKAQWY